jgi:hypothetical protein
MVFYKNLIFYLKLTFLYIFLDYIDLLMLKIINFILMYLLKKKKKTTTKQTLKYSLIQALSISLPGKAFKLEIYSTTEKKA